jgi:hypothetical protein
MYGQHPFGCAHDVLQDNSHRGTARRQPDKCRSNLSSNMKAAHVQHKAQGSGSARWRSQLKTAHLHCRLVAAIRHYRIVRCPEATLNPKYEVSEPRDKHADAEPHPARSVKTTDSQQPVCAEQPSEPSRAENTATRHRSVSSAANYRISRPEVGHCCADAADLWCRFCFQRKPASGARVTIKDRFLTEARAANVDLSHKIVSEHLLNVTRTCVDVLETGIRRKVLPMPVSARIRAGGKKQGLTM